MESIPEKVIILDTETTGLDEKDKAGFTIIASEIHSIIEIACIIEIDGEIKGRFREFGRPWEDDPINHTSMKINGKDVEEIKLYQPQQNLYRKFHEFLESWINPYDKGDKAWLVGWNIGFDDAFLRELFIRNNDNYYGSFFWMPNIELMTLVAFTLMGEGDRRLLPNFKLATVAEKLGFEVEERRFHSAMYDVRVCHRIWRSIIGGA